VSKRITICCYCRKRVYRQKDGTWYHYRNGSRSCRPGEGSDKQATPLEITGAATATEANR
jgi:hypothetical protein